MKTLIYQYYRKLPQQARTHHIIKDDDNYFEYSQKSIQAYAEKYGHDYKFMSDEHPISPFYSIFNPFTEGWAEKYDAICWVDADILATTDAKDIFSQYHPNKISVYFMKSQRRWRGNSMFKWFQDKGHINSGVVIWPRSLYKFVTQYLDLQKEFNKRTILETSLGNFDQAIVNKIVRELDDYHEMDNMWNYHLGRYSHEARWDANLIHYWREHKNMLVDDFKDNRILK